MVEPNFCELVEIVVAEEVKPAVFLWLGELVDEETEASQKLVPDGVDATVTD